MDTSKPARLFYEGTLAFRAEVARWRNEPGSRSARRCLGVISSAISHVAINAEDPAVTLAFYEGVFGWRFTEAYPGFFRMEVEHEVRAIAVQQRRDLLPDGPTTGLEVTISVPDLKAALDAAIAHGGAVLAEPTEIPGVGELVWLRDPGGNVVGAMAYANAGELKSGHQWSPVADPQPDQAGAFLLRC